MAQLEQPQEQDEPPFFFVFIMLRITAAAPATISASTIIVPIFLPNH